MLVSLRRLSAGVVGVAALLTGIAPSVFGQRPAAPPAAPPAMQPALNPNVYVNPQATVGRFPGSTAVLGQPIAAPASTAALMPSYSSGGGYGSLSASYANPGLGYGALNSGVGAGFGFGGGFGALGFGGFGTQWMMNPYQGYLSGAADVTRANADYHMTISQAKLVREESRRSALQTRRALLDELDYERAHAPDPEKIRQQLISRELDRARSSPPADDIFSGRAHNALLRHLINQQGQGVKAEHNVPLNPDTLSHVNLTVGDNRGNVGLLRNNGKLDWPLPLQSVEAFKEPREKLNSLMKVAYQNVSSNELPPDNILNDLNANYEKMQEALDGNLNALSFDAQLEARRYLRYVKNTLTALRDPNVVNHFNGNWKAGVKSVAELVKYMSEKGLWFASATPTDEPAYRSLYYSLASFDAQMPRGTNGNGNSSDSAP